MPFAYLPHWPVTKTNEAECGRVSETMQARVHSSPYVNRSGFEPATFWSL